MKIYKDLEQGTDEWLRVRQGVITGTKLKGVLGGAGAQLTEQYKLIAEKYIVEEDLKPFEIIQRGHDLEPIAKAKYEELTGYTVEEVGFITTEDWLGLSPDGIIWEKDKIIKAIHVGGGYTKGIEIKCPRGPNFVKYIIENKIPKEYEPQVINYFIVIDDLQTLDFIIYNPDVIEGIPNMHIITITRESLTKEIVKAKEKLTQFRTQWEDTENILVTKEKGA